MAKSKIYVPRKKHCRACKDVQQVSFLHPQNLLRVITAHGKLFSRRRSDMCSKCQRELTRNVKWARFIGLLPFVAD